MFLVIRHLNLNREKIKSFRGKKKMDPKGTKQVGDT